MKEAYCRKLKEVATETLQTTLQDDIQTLHNCPTVESWDLGAKLWKVKWQGHKDKSVQKFVSYFIHQWLDNNSGWYQGVASGYPTTNNGVESFNALIKKYHTLRLRLHFPIFLGRMTELLQTHSSDRSGLALRKCFAAVATYPLQIQTNAFHWHEALTTYYKDELNETTIFYVAAAGHPDVSNDSVLATEAKAYRRFKTFKDNFFSFHKIRLNSANWRKSSCSCVCFNEKLVCKHIYGLAVHTGLHSFPNIAIDIPIPGKPKRGRPAKVAVGRTRDPITQEDPKSKD